MTQLLGAVALQHGDTLSWHPLPPEAMVMLAATAGQVQSHGKTLLWEKPKSPRTSEGFFSFCRDQGDLVFGILEHLEVDVV